MNMKQLKQLERVVEDRIRLLVKRRVSSRKKEFLSRKPRNCVNFMRDSRCGLRLKLLCSMERALICPYFECKNTVNKVMRDFMNILDDEERCSREYPKIASLRWIMGLIGNGKFTKK